MSRDIKYIGMDVHQEAIVIAVLNGSGKLVMESIVETQASSILQFIHGLRGELHVTWEEGTWAAWLYDLLQPQVHEVLVCNPRRNALLKEGSKSDKVDARKLADLLRSGMLRPVYHGESGTQVYAPHYREEWLHKIPHGGVRRRAELMILLFKVEDVFDISGRGCVIVPAIPEGLDFRIRAKDQVELRTPDGRVRKTYIASIELAKPQDGSPCRMVIMLPRDIAKHDVPTGTEVWFEPDERFPEERSTP